jgi:hypothetical protein
MDANHFQLGAWLGRRHAFSGLAGQSLAAEAHCLRHIRTARLYLAQSSNWPDFCTAVIGVSRAQVDRSIQFLDEFGDAYFNLNEFIRVSPRTYRALAPNLTPQGLVYEGNLIPLDTSHAPQIAAAVAALRPRGSPPPSTPRIATPAKPHTTSFEEVAAMLHKCRSWISTAKLTPSQVNILRTPAIKIARILTVPRNL